MANVLDLRRRIRSVKNTRQITKAMKMVSAAKLRRAQERAIAARPYAAMLASVLESLVRRTELYDPETGECRHPLLLTRAEKRILLVVVSGDKGFAGAFNTNIVKAAQRFHLENDRRQIDLEPIGPRSAICSGGATRLRQFTEPPEGSEPPRSAGGAATLKSSANIRASGEAGLRADPRDGRVDHRALHARGDRRGLPGLQRIQIGDLAAGGGGAAAAHPEAGRAADCRGPGDDRGRAGADGGSGSVSGRESRSQEAAAAQKQFEEEAKNFGTAEVDYIYEQPPEEIFADLLPRYVTTQIYHAPLESVAAEHAARMTATDAATKNASDMIDSLSLTMNRVRQAAITKEIIEIVSGAAAL